jgi:hypothetical protein
MTVTRNECAESELGRPACFMRRLHHPAQVIDMHRTAREPLFLPYRSDEERSPVRSIPQACRIEVLEEEPLKVVAHRIRRDLFPFS